jgi:hypothetical protein
VRPTEANDANCSTFMDHSGRRNGPKLKGNRKERPAHRNPHFSSADGAFPSRRIFVGRWKTVRQIGQHRIGPADETEIVLVGSNCCPGDWIPSGGIPPVATTHPLTCLRHPQWILLAVPYANFIGWPPFRRHVPIDGVACSVGVAVRGTSASYPT